MLTTSQSSTLFLYLCFTLTTNLHNRKQKPRFLAGELRLEEERHVTCMTKLAQRPCLTALIHFPGAAGAATRGVGRQETRDAAPSPVLTLPAFQTSGKSHSLLGPHSLHLENENQSAHFLGTWEN